jgi:uncharacterized SAM-binding protein YcdF (DUF218 family)
LYYIIIVTYNGPQTAFSEFWLFAFLTGTLLCILLKYFLMHGVKLPPSWSMLSGILIGIGIIIFICIEGAIVSRSKQYANAGMNYIIVLGAQVRGTEITKNLIKRLNTAITYLRDNPETIVIVSGGKGESEALTEAEAMKQYLLRHYIRENRIIKEDRSRNTFENILYSKSLIKSGKTVAIVTNGFHIFRSMRIAGKQGLTVQGLAAPTDALLAVNYYVREVVGVLKDKLVGNI